MKKSIKNWIISWVAFLLTVSLWTFVFAAWTNLPNVSSWNNLTATIWNNLVSKINDIWTRTDWINNTSWWNIWIWNASPNSKLDVSWVIESNNWWFKFPDWTIQTSKAWTIVNVSVAATNWWGASRFSFNLNNWSYPFWTASSATNLFTFNKAWAYMAYAWWESGFLAWQPVVNWWLALTHNYASAEDLNATYFFTASVWTTFKWNFYTNHSNPLTWRNFIIVRLWD